MAALAAMGSVVLLMLVVPSRAYVVGNSLTHPETECSEAEPDCDLSDWSIPQDFCLNDCDFQYKYCADPVARWTYGPSPVTLGSCAVIKCSVVEESINGVSVSFIKGRDGSGCLSDAAYAQCQVSCEQRRQTCRTKCAACAGHCLCACQGVIDTCKDMCLVKHGVCMANNAPVVCNVTANGLEKCCDDELALCTLACDYLTKCREACYRSFTYGWQEPGNDRICARTCGTSEIWPHELFFKRTLLGKVEAPLSATDTLLRVRSPRDTLVPGNLVRIGTADTSEIMQITSISRTCSGSAPPSSSPCVLSLDVRRAQAFSEAAAYDAGATAFLLPCFALNGPEPMCSQMHSTLCAEGMFSWKACP